MARTTGIGAQLYLDTKAWKSSLGQAQRDAAYFQDQITRSTQKALEKGMKGAPATGSARGGRLGQTLLQLGYIADDVQYGLRGVINNIAPIMSAMGPIGMAVGGAATIGLVAWNTFGDSIARAIGLFREAEEAAQALARAVELEGARMERIKRLGEEAREGRRQELETAKQMREEAIRALSREQDLADLRAEMAKLQTTGMGEAERVQAVADIERRRLMERAQAEERLAVAQAARHREEVAALERELRMEEERLARINSRHPTSFLQQEARLERAQAQENVKTLQEALENLRAASDALEQRVQASEHGVTAASMRADITAEQARQRVASLNAQRWMEALDWVSGRMQDWGRAIQEYTRVAEREAEKFRRRQDVETETQIAERRARGDEKGAQALQRQLDRRRRQRDLEEMGFTTDEAQSILNREDAARREEERRAARNARRADGRRRIFGAGWRPRGDDRDEGSGDAGWRLDAFRREPGLRDRGLFDQRRIPEERAARENRARAAAARAESVGAAPKADPAVTGGISTLVNLVQALVNLQRARKDDKQGDK